MKKSVLREYAKLIVRTGVNVQKGQTVLVHAGLFPASQPWKASGECFLFYWLHMASPFSW